MEVVILVCPAANSCSHEDMRLLYGVPKVAIVDCLLEQGIDRQCLTGPRDSPASSAASVTRTELCALRLPELIRLFRKYVQLPDQVAARLYEEYRYRGMKTLYLHECDNINALADLHGPDLNAVIASLESENRGKGMELPFRNLQVADIEDISNERHILKELRYSYIAYVRVIDPETEYPTAVSDLRFGFVWFSCDEHWLAVCARDEVISNMLVEALARHPGIIARRLRIPKSVLQALESNERMRRVTLYDASTGTRRRWTNPNMAHDNDAMQEVQARDEHDERPASGYNEELADGTTFALGYSNDRGKIFFSRDLTVTQMRTWGPAKILELVQAVRDMRAGTPEKLIRDSTGSILKGMPVESKLAAAEITEAIVQCRKQNLSEILLKSDALSLREALGNRVETVLRVDCDICEEPSEIRCSVCGSESIILRNGELVCSDCQQPVQLHDVQCADAHHNVVQCLSDLVCLIPLSSLVTPVSKLVEYSTGRRLNTNEEFFHIRGNRLFFHSSSQPIVYHVDDIPEFAKLLPPTVPEGYRSTIRSQLRLFRERCKHESTEACASCIEDRHGEKCFLRLFGLFDPGHRPYPHQGQELGDYSRLVTLDGAVQRQLVVLIKSDAHASSTHKVTGRQRLGQDIYSQLATYLHRADVDIVGICVPRELDEGFVSSLRLQAKLCHKRLLIMNNEDIVRIVYGTLQRRNLSLDQL